MSFAQPAALFGLIVLPLLVLFYMWRAQHSRQVVSSTWLWMEAMARFSHQPTRRLPLRDPLLLLQLLAALVLVILLAGPRVGQAARLHRIVVLDDSIAMAATDLAPSRFTQAQHRIQSLIADLGEGDRLSVILAGPRARLLGEAPDNGDLAAAIGQLPRPAGAADLAGAAALARGLAGAPAQGTPRVTFIAAAETPDLPAGNLPVSTERLGHTLDDQSIATLAVRCPATSSACQAFARVRNSAAAPRTDELSASVDGQSLGKQVLDIPARGSLDLTFAVPQGARVVRVSLARPDALPEDNSAIALVPAPPRLQALLVSDSPGALLRALQSVPGLHVQAVTTAGYQDTDAAGQDLVVMDGTAPANLPNLPALVIDPPPDSGLVNVRANNVFLPFTTIDPTDSLVAGLDLDGMAGTGEAINTPSWAQVDVDGPRGPLLLHGLQGGQRMVILPFEPSSSSFAQDIAFPLLIARLVHWLVPQPPASVTAGASVWLPSNVQAVQDPSGATLAGPVVDPEKPGLYVVASSNGSIPSGEPMFAVTAAAPGDVVPSVTRVPFWSPLANAGSIPRALWSWVVLAALIALGGEWVFYARKT